MLTKHIFLIRLFCIFLTFCCLIFNRELLTQNGAFAEFLIQYLQEQGEVDVDGKTVKLINKSYIYVKQNINITEVPPEFRNRLNSEASIKDLRR